MKAFRVLTYLCAVVSLVLFATFASAQVIEWNHDPASLIGPEFWGELDPAFRTCGSRIPLTGGFTSPFFETGRKQTPVDIDVATTILTALPALTFQYVATPFIIENTGHVVEVPYAPGSFLRVGQDSYQLLQFHLHAPSEHAINGQLDAAELHLVHRNILLDLAVVGIFLQVGAPVNAVIDRILLNAPLAEGGVDLGGVLNARDVLPQFVSYYNYSGSLTTPPCSEGVRWFVLKEPVFVSQAAIDRFHLIISQFPGYEGFPDNNRPIRPLNGRAILNRIGR